MWAVRPDTGRRPDRTPTFGQPEPRQSEQWSRARPADNSRQLHPRVGCTAQRQGRLRGENGSVDRPKRDSLRQPCPKSLQQRAQRPRRKFQVRRSSSVSGPVRFEGARDQVPRSGETHGRERRSAQRCGSSLVSALRVDRSVLRSDMDRRRIYALRDVAMSNQRAAARQTRRPFRCRSVSSPTRPQGTPTVAIHGQWHRLSDSLFRSAASCSCH